MAAALNEIRYAPARWFNVESTSNTRRCEWGPQSSLDTHQVECLSNCVKHGAYSRCALNVGVHDQPDIVELPAFGPDRLEPHSSCYNAVKEQGDANTARGRFGAAQH